MSIQLDKPSKHHKHAQKIANFATFRKPVFRVKACRSAHAGRYHFIVRARVAGRWTRRYFESKKPAETYAQIKNIEIENQGRESAEFPTWLRVMAADCHADLRPFQKTIRDATDHFLASLNASQKSCNIDQLATELIEAKRADGVSGRYLADLCSRLNRFGLSFRNQAIATITTAQIDDWLRGLDSRRLAETIFGG